MQSSVRNGAANEFGALPLVPAGAVLAAFPDVAPRAVVAVRAAHVAAAESPRPHVAIIMDGNGRWAEARRLPRVAGPHAGIAALREVTEAAAKLGVGTLTVYAFSVDNWKRPPAEVSALMGLLRSYLENELARLVTLGVKLDIIGRRDRLPDGLAPLITHAERVTADGQALNLRVAIDYSGRDAILAAASACASAGLSREAMSRQLEIGAGGPNVDLLIRTSGEQRLSDFLLWEVAYAELYFTPRMWPDFGHDDLEHALRELSRRDRRFGGLNKPAAKSVDGYESAAQTRLASATGSATPATASRPTQKPRSLLKRFRALLGAET